MKIKFLGTNSRAKMAHPRPSINSLTPLPRENNISFSPDALRSELWILCKRHRVEKTSKIVEEIAKKYGHEVLRLPPYHCELNAIELI